MLIEKKLPYISYHVDHVVVRLSLSENNNKNKMIIWLFISVLMNYQYTDTHGQTDRHTCIPTYVCCEILTAKTTRDILLHINRDYRENIEHRHTHNPIHHMLTSLCVALIAYPKCAQIEHIH